MATIAEVAAQIHAHLCKHHTHGYTQGGDRWGTGRGTETLTIEGRKYQINLGDFDCSSSTTYAWQKALEGTPYEGVLGNCGYDKHGSWRSWYTGNMRDLFVGSGLFKWVPISQAQRGDLYLNETNHVAMCQGNGLISEFLLNEHGTIIGGTPGDQTGGESIVHSFRTYSFGWDGCLHCVKNIEIGDIVTNDDIKKIAEAVWNFNQNGVKCRDRLQGTDSAANGALQAATAAKNALLTPADASGRNKKSNMPDRLAWVGKRLDDIENRQAKMDKQLDELIGLLKAKK